jgi:hypothetical protein
MDNNTKTNIKNALKTSMFGNLTLGLGFMIYKFFSKDDKNTKISSGDIENDNQETTTSRRDVTRFNTEDVVNLKIIPYEDFLRLYKNEEELALDVLIKAFSFLQKETDLSKINETTYKIDSKK